MWLRQLLFGLGLILNMTLTYFSLHNFGYSVPVNHPIHLFALCLVARLYGNQATETFGEDT